MSYMRRHDLDLHAGWAIDFSSFERALTPRTRAVLVVSPNNPTGSFLSPAELDRLAELCVPRGIALIADEVFADYELEPGAAARRARVAGRDDLLTFSLGGLSKSVGLPQAKLGWIAVGGPTALALTLAWSLSSRDAALRRTPVRAAGVGIAPPLSQVRAPSTLGAPPLVAAPPPVTPLPPVEPLSVWTADKPSRA